ncbi:MAG: Bax inhibitor-1/YccA family protein [Candidatus Omnitrophica bacterium]|nr:Bax inhibitor-1/YccA family protein [Candidatus Omnitrophota bacterium]
MNTPFNASSSSSFSPETSVRTFIQRVYHWMAIGLALTGFVAYWTASHPTVLRALAGGGFWILAIAEIGLVFWLSASITKISAQAATLAFLAYAFLNGLTMSFVFLAYTGASIATVFFMTAGTFGAVSVFGWTTKADLSSAQGFFAMALIGVIIASIANIFMHSTILYWIISYAGLGVFIGLTAYDTQKLKGIHQNSGGTEQTAILGALALYLDFINMFLYMMRIFGKRRD